MGPGNAASSCGWEFHRQGFAVRFDQLRSTVIGCFRSSWSGDSICFPHSAFNLPKVLSLQFCVCVTFFLLSRHIQTISFEFRTLLLNSIFAGYFFAVGSVMYCLAYLGFVSFWNRIAFLGMLYMRFVFLKLNNTFLNAHVTGLMGLEKGMGRCILL